MSCFTRNLRLSIALFTHTSTFIDTFFLPWFFISRSLLAFNFIRQYLAISGVLIVDIRNLTPVYLLSRLLLESLQHNNRSFVRLSSLKRKACCLASIKIIHQVWYFSSFIFVSEQLTICQFLSLKYRQAGFTFAIRAHRWVLDRWSEANCHATEHFSPWAIPQDRFSLLVIDVAKFLHCLHSVHVLLVVLSHFVLGLHARSRINDTMHDPIVFKRNTTSLYLH